MLMLYHGATSVCSAKVRLVLAEKQLAWEGKVLDLNKGDQFDPAYRKLNPNAVVPTLVHDGQLVRESTVICEYLDEVFTDFPLRPATALGRAQMRGWTKREDAIHGAINSTTTAIVVRPELLAKTAADQDARIDGIPDPARRRKFRDLLAKGMASPAFDDALIQFARLLRDMEDALDQGPWLLGEQFTLADAGLLAYFYRLELLSLAGLWREHFPRVGTWLDRAKARASFKSAIQDFIPEHAARNYAKFGAGMGDQVRPLFAQVLKEI